MSSQPRTFLTEEEYLELERKAECKSEYYRGEIFAMGGAREPHHVLVANLVGELRQQLRKRPCRVYPSDMRVRVSATGFDTYPDVSVACEEPQFADERADTLLNPTFIAEVLSHRLKATTAAASSSTTAPSDLAEYLLVAQDRIHVDLYTRQPDGHWVLSGASCLEDRLELRSVGCHLALADLYEKVDLTASNSSPLCGENTRAT